MLPRGLERRRCRAGLCSRGARHRLRASAAYTFYMWVRVAPPYTPTSQAHVILLRDPGGGWPLGPAERGSSVDGVGPV